MKLHVSTTIIAAATVLSLLGCTTGPPNRSVPLLITVRDTTGSHVPGAHVTLNGGALGATDLNGRLSHQLSGIEGQQLHVSVDCPAGTRHMGPAAQTAEVRFLAPIDPQNGPIAPLRLDFTCEPLRRPHVVVVRTNLSQDFPIALLGELAHRTGPSGVCQFVVEGQPGEEIELRIDTSGAPSLRPASPVRAFRLPQVSGLLIFDQYFEKRAPKARRKTQSRRGPRRI